MRHFIEQWTPTVRAERDEQTHMSRVCGDRARRCPYALRESKLPRRRKLCFEQCALWHIASRYVAFLKRRIDCAVFGHCSRCIIRSLFSQHLNSGCPLFKDNVVRPLRANTTVLRENLGGYLSKIFAICSIVYYNENTLTIVNVVIYANNTW